MARTKFWSLAGNTTNRNHLQNSERLNSDFGTKIHWRAWALQIRLYTGGKRSGTAEGGERIKAEFSLALSDTDHSGENRATIRRADHGQCPDLCRAALRPPAASGRMVRNSVPSRPLDATSRVLELCRFGHRRCAVSSEWG